MDNFVTSITVALTCHLLSLQLSLVPIPTHYQTRICFFLLTNGW
jgi:hypothetical protein